MLDLDTFLVAVYVIVDELYQAWFAPRKPRRPGPRPHYSDSEIVTLALLAQYHPARSERAFLRFAAAHWAAAFPALPTQSTFNRRVRDLEGVLSALGPHLAQQVYELTGQTLYEVLDGTPVPLLRRCRGHRHKLFAAEAAFGRGGSDRAWFYGLDLVGAVSVTGAITGYVLAPANTEERWSVETLLQWRRNPTRPVPTAAELEPVLGPPHRTPRHGPTGPIATPLGAGVPAAGPYLADRGLSGRAWHQHWHDDLGATVLTAAELPQPAPGDPAGWRERRRARRWLSRLREVAETTYGRLIELFGLCFPRARTYQGVRTRVAAKVAICNLALLLNLLFDQPPQSRFNPILA